jgi:hypothetical protein
VLIALGANGLGVALAMLAITLLTNNALQNLLEPLVFGKTPHPGHRRGTRPADHLRPRPGWLGYGDDRQHPQPLRLSRDRHRADDAHRVEQLRHGQRDLAADLLDDDDVLVAHRRRALDGLDPRDRATGPSRRHRSPTAAGWRRLVR